MIAWIAGRSSRPRSVSSYSTDGGEVGITRRATTPFSSSSRSRALSTRAEILGMSIRSSPNRRGCALKYQMTFGAHAPLRSAMHVVTGQDGSGELTLLRRTGSGIGNSEVTTKHSNQRLVHILRILSALGSARGEAIATPPSPTERVKKREP